MTLRYFSEGGNRVASTVIRTPGTGISQLRLVTSFPFPKAPVNK